MRQKLDKKLFSLENIEFINAALKDISAITKKSESSIAEEVLLSKRQGLLPSNALAADIVLPP